MLIQRRVSMGHDARAASTEWQRWLDERVVSLERAQLLRSLRPIVPTLNPMQARAAGSHTSGPA